jgi:hypothetical protein
VSCPVAADDVNADICAWLATDDASVLTEAPAADEICTMQYGGPETATVTGTLGGEQVDASFSRTDGCNIARFDAASVLWMGVPEPMPTDAGGGGAAAGACLANPDTPVTSSPADGDAAVTSPGGAADVDCGPPPGTPPASAPTSSPPSQGTGVAPPSGAVDGAPAPTPEIIVDPPRDTDVTGGQPR